MVKMTVKIEGMACGMCETHINDTIRKNFTVKKVTSSHKKGESEIIVEEPLDETALKKAIADTGYTVLSIETAPYEKKGFLASIFG